MPVDKTQISKFTFLIRKSQIRIFLQNTAQLKSKYLLTFGRFESAEKLGSANPKSTNYKSSNHKIGSAKVPHLRLVCKSTKLLKSANLRICDFRNLFANRPPSHFDKHEEMVKCTSLFFRKWIFSIYTKFCKVGLRVRNIKGHDITS